MNGALKPGRGIERVRVRTALGEFMVEASARGIRAVTPIHGVGRNLEEQLVDACAVTHARTAAEALRRYAAGERARFDGPFDLQAPALRIAVWERLRTIPFGATTTYGEIAAAVGQPGEARAIGQAVGANPVCVLIPCHRVVAAGGGLRGFAWGLDLKRRLLAHEGSRALELFEPAGWCSVPEVMCAPRGLSRPPAALLLLDVSSDTTSSSRLAAGRDPSTGTRT